MNKGKYDLTTVIGVSVSVIAFILILIFKPGMTNTQKPASAVPQGDQTQAVENAASAPAQDVSAAAVTDGQAATRLVASDDEKAVRLSLGDEFVLDVSPNGAGISSLTLNDYLLNVPGKTGDNGPVVLADKEYPFLVLQNGNSALALQAPAADAVKSGNDFVEMVRLSGDGRLRVTEKWSLVPEKSYEIDYTVSFENISGGDVYVGGYSLEGAAMPTSVTPDRKASRGESAGGVSVSMDGKVKDYSLKALAKISSEEHQRMLSQPVKWAAVHSKYFVMAYWLKDLSFSGIETTAVASAKREGVETKPNSRYHVIATLPGASLAPGGTCRYEVCAYAGPKMFERLYGYGFGLESVMEMDRFFFWRPFWMRQISRGLLKMLVLISDLFPKSIGYGMAIILLTILVKLVFWPLSHKSMASMRRMQALKPELDEIRAKYKDDPSTMYRKQQELFKKNNVSQLGGCLPMLLQIPVFFALFNTFRNAIEMRHASFLWAYDLSVPDTLSFSPEAIPIRPLALLMGVTMYFQQKMTPNPDPQQAKMMNFMSLFFIVLFYNMPSALTLYLSVSYLLGIVQTALTNKLMPPVALPSGQNAKKGAH